MKHTFNNGMTLDVSRGGIPDYFINERYTVINLHEPIEEVIFTQIVLNSDCKYYFNFGASIGYYAILAKLLNEEIAVTAIELEEWECSRIFENSVINDVEIFVDNVAINQPGEDNECDINEYLDLFNFVPDFISMDIQGAELYVLRNIDDRLKQVKELLVGTHYTQNSHYECLDILETAGFHIQWCAKPGSVWRQPDGLIWARNMNGLD